MEKHFFLLTLRPPYWWGDKSKSASFKLRHGCKTLVPGALIVPVIKAIHVYSHASVDKTVELFSRRLEKAKHTATQLNKLVGDTIEHCYVPAATKAPLAVTSKVADRLRFKFIHFLVLQWTSCHWAHKHPANGQTVDMLIVIVCRWTGYILAIPCAKAVLTSELATRLSLDRSVHFIGLPREIHCQNAWISNSAFCKSQMEPGGVDMHNFVLYRVQIHERTERAVSSINPSLRCNKSGACAFICDLYFTDLNDYDCIIHDCRYSI